MKQIITKDTSEFWETKKGGSLQLRKFISMKANIMSKPSMRIGK